MAQRGQFRADFPVNCQITKNESRWLIKATDVCNSEITVKEEKKETRILVIDKRTALKCWLVKNGKYDQLIVSEALPIQNGEMVEFLSNNTSLIDFKLYPSISATPKINMGTITKMTDTKEIYSHYQIKLQEQSVKYEVKHLGNKLAINISSGIPAGVKDVICRVNYKGDTGQGFINGELIADNFYNGIPWDIGLKRFLEKPNSNEMVFYFRPMYKKAQFLQDLNPSLIPNFNERGQFLEVGDPEFFIEYSVKLKF